MYQWEGRKLMSSLRVKILALLSVMIMPVCSFAADVSSVEREGMMMRVELNRLGTSAEPSERETLLRKIAERCKGTEEGERAYWDLADLYLEGFPEEMRDKAREILEQCIKAYPNSLRASMVRCKLAELYDTGSARREELVRQIKKDNMLPEFLRSGMK